MNRRMFLKALAAVSGASIIPQTFSLSSMYRQANAGITYSSLNVAPPAVMPQIINIFLYGGPSELAGNLSNIAEIEQSSQSKYTDFFPGILDPQAAGTDGSVTPSGFWGSNSTGNGTDNGLGAGGDDMQFLLDQGHMSVYRTMMKRKNTSQSHRESILMSQKGSLDIDFAPGFGFKLAALISENRALYEGSTALADGSTISNVDNLIMPFVSVLDGDTRIFDKDTSVTVPLLFNGISVNVRLGNPFSRSIQNAGDPVAEDAMMEALVQKTLNQDPRNYADVLEAFKLRQELADAMSSFDGAFNNGGPGLNLPLLPADPLNPDTIANGGSQTLVYPNTSIGRSLRAAVTLAVENPGTLFATVGGAFGGWDDHNNGVDRYPQRMRDVFDALRVAMMHIKYTHNTTTGSVPTPINGLTRSTDNIIINVFGDFGRRVNLNASLGWNHGNNQNFFTLGGGRPGLRTATGGAGPLGGLGKIVGTTARSGNAGEDRQYTVPANSSYEFEPMSVAASIYKYFGADYSTPISENNPDHLTAFEDPNNAGQFLDFGTPPIEEDPAKNGAV